MAYSLSLRPLAAASHLKHIRLLKAGSQSDTRPCIALIREMHKLLFKQLVIS